MLLAAPPYCPSRFVYQRRRSREVQIGTVAVGATQPIRVQSMTTTRTQDVEATLAQSMRLVEAGCEIVRITAPTVNDAKAIGEIKRRLRARGIDVPLVADIHFSPAAAMEAANHVEKVRINPGNFADSRQFAVREYTDREYEEELARIEERFTPLVLKCKSLGVAMRVGTNHGSLSDRGHSARNGRVRPGVSADLPEKCLSRCDPLDEGVQPEGDDPGLSPPRRPDGRDRDDVPTSPRRHGGRQRRGRPDQERGRDWL